jgi:hypothetical protein
MSSRWVPPTWTLKFVIWFGVIGFPCALIFSWVFELIPEQDEPAYRAGAGELAVGNDSKHRA